MARQKSVKGVSPKLWREIYEKKDDIDVNLRRYEPFIPISYDELTNFLDIDESDGEEENNDLIWSIQIWLTLMLFQIEIQIIFLFLHSLLRFYYYHQNSFILCALNLMMLISVSYILKYKTAVKIMRKNQHHSM